MTLDLFNQSASMEPLAELIAPGACVLRGMALAQEQPLWQALLAVMAQAPLRHMQTPGA